MTRFPQRGRGASYDPPNRFERLNIALDDVEEHTRSQSGRSTEFFVDATRTILARNDSPDVGFQVSVNPYRGCEHGCVYCYARQGHEFLGLSGGLDFESKIFVKTEAPALLRQALSKRGWAPQVVAISGVTDPYQPVERRLELTRRCLKVFSAFGNPVAIITKNHLVTRDIDILAEMAERRLVKVMISITSLKDDLILKMEPRTSRPNRRLQAIEKLTKAGVPTGVMLAPIVPGLTDEEMPEILKAAAAAGAMSASYIVLRLPGIVQDLFLSWLEDHYPARLKKVSGRLRSLRNGKLSDSRFGHRMRGEGEFASVLEMVFTQTVDRLGLNQRYDLDANCFVRPTQGQLSLF